jgi:hypothetical protein
MVRIVVNVPKKDVQEREKNGGKTRSTTFKPA